MLDRAKRCTHCGDLVPPARLNTDDNENQFCCTGCETVYEILSGKDLSDYYSLKKRFDERAGNKPADSIESFDYLDDPNFQKEQNIDPEKGLVFFLEGVHCVACLWLVEKLPQLVSDVTDAKVNMAAGTVDVKLHPGGSFAKAAEMLATIGYPPHPLYHESDYHKLFSRENRNWLIRLGVSGALTGNIMLLAVSIYAGAEGFWKEKFHLLSLFLSLPILSYGAWPFFRSALGALKVKKISIDVPIALAIILGSSASLYSLFTGSDHIYFDSLSALVFLLLSSRYLLRRIHERALSSQRFINVLTPRSAKRFNPETFAVEVVATSSLSVGDTIVVDPGEVCPTDGYLLNEKALVDASLFSGESEPIEKLRNDEIFGGYRNIGGMMRLKISSASVESRLGKIISEINRPSKDEPLASTIADKAAGYFVAITLLVASGILAYFSSSDFTEGFERALAFIIIVCPCALALAVPLSYALFMGKALREGIVFKSSRILEKLTEVKSIFFDKTGTLTTGEMTITNFWLAPGEKRTEIERILYLLEKDSKHPIAKAISKEILNRNPQLKSLEGSQVNDFVEVVGVGPQAEIDGKRFAIRSATVTDKKQREPSHRITGAVCLVSDDRILAKVTFEDKLIKEAAPTVNSLSTKGFTVKVLSGDRKENVERLITNLGLKNIEPFAEKSPEEKRSIIAADQRAAMVGDGANDALSLREAYVGIAVHGSLEVSFDAADVIFTNQGLKKIETIFIIADRCKKVVNRNLLISLLYNSIGGVMAILGFIDPLAAAVLMPLSSVTVLLSTLVGAERKATT